MLLLHAHRKLIPFGELQRKQTKVFHQPLAINPDLQIADDLIEREIDLVLLLNANGKAELHRPILIY